MVYKRVSSVLFFSIVWMLLVCPKAYSQSNSMRVARIFSDNMVLQQGIYAPVWGWADSGATVRISMSEKEYETVADDTGKWLVKMEPLPAQSLLRLTFLKHEVHPHPALLVLT